MLLVSELGLLPPTDERFVKSCEAIGRDLARNGQIMRYTEPDDFGAPETAFLACNFWYMDALGQIGRKAEARELFEIDPGAPQRLWSSVGRHRRPDKRRTVGQLAADLFHGGNHQHRDALVVELGGSMGSRLIIVSNRVPVPETNGRRRRAAWRWRSGRP